VGVLVVAVRVLAVRWRLTVTAQISARTATTMGTRMCPSAHGRAQAVKTVPITAITRLRFVKELDDGCGAEEVDNDEQRGGDEDDLLGAQVKQPREQQAESSDEADGGDAAGEYVALAEARDRRAGQLALSGG
jgi:hypothetical protein